MESIPPIFPVYVCFQVEAWCILKVHSQQQGISPYFFEILDQPAKHKRFIWWQIKIEHNELKIIVWKYLNTVASYSCLIK